MFSGSVVLLVNYRVRLAYVTEEEGIRMRTKNEEIVVRDNTLSKERGQIFHSFIQYSV